MIRECKYCSYKTKNPVFCSSRCSATFNSKNRISKKRKIKYCTNCKIKIADALSHTTKRLCNECGKKYSNKRDWSLTTIKELRSNLPKFQFHARIRALARRNYKKAKLPKQCCFCGYNKYYEVCHRIPISKFLDSATIAEVNDLSNLMAMCRNCHWEFDHSLIS